MKNFKIKLGHVVLALVLMFVATVSANAYTYTTKLMQGSHGQAVMDLQTALGVTPVDGSFGPITKAAVVAFQAAHSLTADGIVGPMTGAALAGTSVGGSYPAGCTSNTGYSTTTGASCATNSTLPAGCTSTMGYSSTTGVKCDSTTPSTPTGPLAGTAGSIADMNRISSYNGEEVGAGMDDVKVLGFDVQATNDGDIALTSMKVRFDSTGNASGDSDRIEDYITGVSIWQGSTKVGSADAEDFSKDSTGIYTKTVSLTNSVVRSDDTENFYISVDAVSNLDSGDIDSDSWTIALDNVRFMDGSGVVTTETSAIPTDMDWDSAGDGVAISFVSFSSAADTELKISLDSTSPLSGVVTVNTTSDTNDVVLMKGTMEVKGTSDVWLDEVPFLFTTNATNVDDVTPTVYFTIDDDEFSESMTSSAGTTEVITFNDMDKTLTAGEKYKFTVTADVNDIETTYFDEGDYLSAALDATRRASIIAENEEGDQLTDSTEMTGVASGNIQYFYSVAPSVEVVSASITPNDNGSSAATSATAKLKLKITAQGGTVYLNGDDESTAGKELITLTYDGGDATTSVASYYYTTTGTYTTTNGAADNEYYTLNDGDVMYVEITGVVARGAGGTTTLLTGMKGTAILFGTDSTSDTTRSVNSLSFTALTDLLKSGLTSLNRTSA